MSDDHALPAEVSSIYQKFARVLVEVPEITKDQTADIKKDFSYNYADINSILRMLKPILAKNGLAISQPASIDDHDNIVVTTMIVDTETGHSITFPGPGFPVKGDPQAAGSALTYFRRYAIVNLFSLGAHDDDGKSAKTQHDSPTGRTPAEAETRAIIGGLDEADRNRLIQDFRAEFGMGLVDLPTERHGDALGWVKSWTAPAPDEVEAQG
jgi:hypothetical protein